MTEQVIQLEKVNKWYDDFHVLKDIDLSVEKGQKIVIFIFLYKISIVIFYSETSLHICDIFEIYPPTPPNILTPPQLTVQAKLLLN